MPNCVQFGYILPTDSAISSPYTPNYLPKIEHIFLIIWKNEKDWVILETMALL